MDKRPDIQKPDGKKGLLDKNWMEKDLMDKRPDGQKPWWTKHLLDKRPDGQKT